MTPALATEPVGRALVLLSGGMDSVMALLWARKAWDCEAIAIHYGQRHFSELAAAWDITKALDVPFEQIELSSFSSIAPSTLTGRISGSVVVPNRNAFFLSVAGAVAMAKGIDRIVVGCNADDAADFPDCRSTFLASMETTLRFASGRPIEIVAPWLDLTKAQALRLYVRTDDEMALIRRSVSCYHGQVPGCGDCAACAKRSAAFAGASAREVA
jgi:7-cyano-7-deazaguanine synthase